MPEAAVAKRPMADRKVDNFMLAIPEAVATVA